MSKPTKLETLNADLAVAKKAFEDAVLRLQPQIAAEQAAVDALRAANEKASRASSKAYEVYQQMLRDVEALLFPAEVRVRLAAAIREKVSAQFPEADVGRLAQEFQGKAVSADPEVVVAYGAYKAASEAYKKASRAWNVATSPDSKLSKLKRELDSFLVRVEKLEADIVRLPRYRQAAKDRREEERREALKAEQTQAARELLADFRFEG